MHITTLVVSDQSMKVVIEALEKEIRAIESTMNEGRSLGSFSAEELRKLEDRRVEVITVYGRLRAAMSDKRVPVL